MFEEIHSVQCVNCHGAPGQYEKRTANHISRELIYPQAILQQYRLCKGYSAGDFAHKLT